MIIVYTDGLCEPTNPGGTAAYGWVAYRGQEKIGEGYKVVAQGPEATNNVAEYSGIIAVLKWLLENNLSKENITLKSDSQLCICQLQGHYRVRSPRIFPLYQEVVRLLRKFTNLALEWIPREENEEADALSRKAKQEHNMASGVISHGDDIYVVASESRPNTFYTVDLRNRTCSCPHFTIRKKECKHIKFVDKETKIEVKKETLERVYNILNKLDDLESIDEREIEGLKNFIGKSLGR